MKKLTLKQRLSYWFDNSMAQGSIALMGWLFLLSVVFIFVISFIVMVSGIDPSNRDFFHLAWASLMRTLDAGTMGADEGDWYFLFAMLVVTLGGIFLISTLIGILTTGLDEKLQELRKGRSVVAEQDHIVILGWSSQIFNIINELITANESNHYTCIAILANEDKVEMEDQLVERIGKVKKTRFVCRTGNPVDLKSLEIINPHNARAIIILPPEGDDPDAQVIKSVLALTNHPQRHPEPYHIVAVIRDPRNLEAARLVGGKEATFILAYDVTAQLIAQTCRQAGLSTAYMELLTFSGDEIYFKAEPQLQGKTVSEALFAYEKCSVIGLFNQESQQVKLLPPLDTVISAQDKVIVIAADDSEIKLTGMSAPKIANEVIQPHTLVQPQPERTLILGWNQRVERVIRELDNYVIAGSEVLVVADIEPEQAEAVLFSQMYQHLTVRFQQGNTTRRAVLDNLNIPTYHHVIVLSYFDSLELQKADSCTLITLLHLRDIEQKVGQAFSVVSEMLDMHNRELAEVTQADDFIVSDNLISLLLAQLCENKHLAAVFEDLFDADGAEIYLKPAENYIALNQPITFYTLLEAAKQRGEIAIGYHQAEFCRDKQNAYGVKINPRKSEAFTLKAGDRVIVLGQN